MTVWTDEGWRVVTVDEHPRPGTTMEDLAKLRPPSARAAGSPPATPPGSTTAPAACCWPAEAPTSSGWRRRCASSTTPSSASSRRRWAGARSRRPRSCSPRPGLTIDDIDAVEMNEAFAVQCVAFLDHFGIPLDSTKVNPYGGAIALGHPLAMSGARLAQQLAHRMEHDDSVRYGITTLCIGLGMGCTVLWERV
jgi:acetyl-CoA acyltransferase